MLRDARDDGRRALEILREHYQGKGKPRIITLYTELTSLKKQGNETIVDYVIRAETSATALREVDEVISDALLIAIMVLLRISLLCALHIYLTAFDARRSTQAWLQNLALFRSISSKKAKKDESI